MPIARNNNNVYQFNHSFILIIVRATSLPRFCSPNDQHLTLPNEIIAQQIGTALLVVQDL
jgi:hypothetical protein